MSSKFESTTNPYAAPRSLSPPVAATASETKPRQIRLCCGLQIIVILAALGFESLEHESILVSGPVLFLVGCLIAFPAIRIRDVPAALTGLSAVGFTAFVFLLIYVNGWGPSEADLPVSILIYVYSAAAIPLLAYLTLRRSPVVPSPPSCEAME